MSKPDGDVTQFNEELDAIVTSDEALKTALQSDDSIIKTAARLTNNRHPTLSATARQNILANVLDATPTTTAPPNVIKGNFVGWLGRVAAIFIITIMVGLAAQPASANSLPGDALYPVKLGFESLTLVFADSPSARVQTYLNHANERLSEVQRLEPESDLRDETVLSAITSLNFVATIASDNPIFESNPNLIEEVESTLSNFEQALSNNQIPSELITDVQLSLMSVRALLPVNPTNTVELTPEVTPEATSEVILIEITPEATVEATDEPTSEVITVEATDDPTPEVVTPEVTDEPTPEVVTPEVTDEPQTIIPLAPTTYYIHPDGRVNVRSGAGTNFDIVGVANQNTPVTVLSQNLAGDWLEVRLPNGLQGWVFRPLLDDTPGQSSNSGNANSDTNNGNADGNNNGTANGNSNGNANGNSSGNANGGSNGNANGNANGGSNGNANGNSNGNANGNSNGNANGNSSGNANGNSNGNANGNSSGNANGGSNGNANGNNNGNANGN